MKHDQTPDISPDQIRRILWTLRTIGQAHLQGGIDVSDTLPFGQKCEVLASLDEMAKFAASVTGYVNTDERA